MRLRRTAFNLVLTLASLAVALLAVEGVLRVWNPFDYRIKGERIVLPVNNVYEVRVEGGNGLDPVVRHRRNGLGFRGPEPPADFGAAVTVLAVGGSTTEGFYLSQGESWPERLGAALESVIAPLWLNNAGLDGHSTFGHLVLVEDMVLDLGPDVVLFLVGWNDMDKVAPGVSDARSLRAWGGGWSLRQWAYTVANRTEVGGLALNLYRSYKSRKLGLGHQVTTFDWGSAFEFLDIPDDERERVLARHRTRYLPGFRDRLGRIVEVTRAAGILPVLLTQPVVLGRVVDPRTGIDLGRLSARYGNGALTWDLMEIYNDVTRAVAREAGVPLVDLARAMPKDSTYFYDKVHFNKAGAARVAKIVFGDLCPILAARFPDNAVGACTTP